MRHGGTAGNGAPVLCRSKKGQCPGGYHAALASMTRAQCEDVAKGCKWKLGKEFLAAVLAADGFVTGVPGVDAKGSTGVLGCETGCRRGWNRLGGKIRALL